MGDITTCDKCDLPYNYVRNGFNCPNCPTPTPSPPTPPTEGEAEGPFKIEIVTGGAIVTGPCMDDPPHPPVPAHLAEEARDLYNRIYAAGASTRGSGEAAEGEAE